MPAWVDFTLALTGFLLRIGLQHMHAVNSLKNAAAKGGDSLATHGAYTDQLTSPGGTRGTVADMSSE